VLFLASFILKGQSQAALVAAAMAILGLLVPPAAWISAATIVLDRKSVVEGKSDVRGSRGCIS